MSTTHTSSASKLENKPLKGNAAKLSVKRSDKVKVKMYKCFNITEDELKAIINGQEQMRSDAESAHEEYAEWANTQIKLINSFYRKVKIQ